MDCSPRTTLHAGHTTSSIHTKGMNPSVRHAKCVAARQFAPFHCRERPIGTTHAVHQIHVGQVTGLSWSRGGSFAGRWYV